MRRRQRKRGVGARRDLFSLNTKAPSSSTARENVGGGILCIRGFLWGFSKTRTQARDAASAVAPARPHFPPDFPVLSEFKGCIDDFNLQKRRFFSLSLSLSQTHDMVVQFRVSPSFPSPPSHRPRPRLKRLLSWRGRVAWRGVVAEKE